MGRRSLVQGATPPTSGSAIQRPPRRIIGLQTSPKGLESRYGSDLTRRGLKRVPSRSEPRRSEPFDTPGRFAWVNGGSRTYAPRNLALGRVPDGARARGSRCPTRPRPPRRRDRLNTPCKTLLLGDLHRGGLRPQPLSRRLNERALGFRLPLASAIALVGDQAVELVSERLVFRFRVADAQLTRQRRRSRGRALAAWSVSSASTSSRVALSCFFSLMALPL